MNSLERLESRIAPATLSAKVVTYVDPDGDSISVTISKGALDLATNFVFAPSGLGEQLQQIILDPAFAKANVTVEVTTTVGDGKADVGFIDAGGVDLGKVSVAGDLGRIIAGDDNAKSPALKSLTVHSLGTQGLGTQGGIGDLISTISGKVGKLFVTEEGINNAQFNVIGGSAGSIGGISIVGSLIGSTIEGSGAVTATGNIGRTLITGDLQGGIGDFSGRIFTDAKLKSVTVTGNIVGGSGFHSGGIFSEGNLGAVLVTGSVTGGEGSESGSIDSDAALKSVHIQGSLIGGPAFDSGSIDSNANTKFVIIDGAIQGGGADEAGSVQIDGNLGKAIFGSIAGGTVQFSGLDVDGKIGSVTVNGDVQGGDGFGSGSIFSGSSIGRVFIDGNLIGGNSEDSGLLAADGPIKRVQITGSLIGGSDFDTGQIFSGGNTALVQIGGNVLGGSGTFSGYIDVEGVLKKILIGTESAPGNLEGGAGQESGVIFTATKLAKAEITGSILSGAGELSGAIDSNGSIGKLLVGQNITGTSDVPVNISAFAKKAIGTISVQGDVSFANILAGHNDVEPENEDSSIGKVLIGGNMTATNIVAGVADPSGDGFGTGDEVPISATTRAISKIALVQVGGMAIGTILPLDHYGITAEFVKRVSIGGTNVELQSGPRNDFVAVPGVATNDYRIFEAGAAIIM